MIGTFVGREREVAQVGEGLVQVMEGRGGVFLLVGEPGIGKTRLADVVAHDATTRGLRVAWARCWEGDGAPAYWPWTQVLAELGEALPKGPEATTDASAARFALFEVVTARLVEIARRTPLLLVLDDLHVADVSSLILLQFVARAIRGVPIGIVGTYRDVDTRITSEAERILTSIAREATYLPLDRFDVEEITDFAAGLGIALSDTRLAEVVRVTEGNPLFVNHVVRTLPRFAVPPSLRAALRDRLAEVADQEARELLATAAVAGREVKLATLARVAGVPPTLAAERLSTAMVAGVLEPIGTMVRFTHVLLRDESYASLPAERRAALHAALADVVDELHPAAHHALAGVTVVGAERAADAVLRAAARSMAMLAFEDAVLLLSGALEVLEPIADSGQVVDLTIARGRALLLAGDASAGKRSCVLAAERARALGDGRRLAEAALTYGSEFRPALVDPELCDLLEESLRILPADARALRARTMARLAAARQPAPDPSVPMAMAREAIALARDLPDDDRRAVLFAASSALADRGEPGECVALDTDLAELAQRAGDRVQALRAEARLVFDHLEVGDVASADQHLTAYAELVADFREPRYRWPLVLMRAMRALFDGKLDEVDRLHEEALAIERDDANLRMALGNQRAHRLIAENRFDEAAALARDYATMTSRAPRLAVVVHAILALIATRRGDRTAAASEVEALRRLQIRLEDPVTAKLVAEAYAFVGEPPERERLYRTLEPRAAGLATHGLTGMVIAEPVSRLLALLSSAPAEPQATSPARAASPPRFSLQLDGDYFKVESDGAAAMLRTSQGLRLLALLTEHPGREHHVLALAPADESDAGEALDPRAIEAYRARAESLRDELSEAERYGDPTRAAHKRAELEQIAAELARGVGLGGRARRVASGAERARINVQRHLRKAIRAIGEHFPSLCRHLERSVKTGTFCRYDPE